MNRVKVWVYAVVVAAAAIVTLRTHALRLRAGALEDLDARLAAGSAQALASARAIAREASAAAALAARDADLVQALHAKEGAPGPLPRRSRARPARRAADEDAQENALREAARAALASAERTLGFELPAGTVVTAGNRGWLAGKGEREAEGEAMALLRGAIGGKARRGYVRLNGVLFLAAASPAGDGAGLVVLAPLDEAFAKNVTAGAGVQATLSVPEVTPVSTAGADARLFSSWARAGGVTSDVGELASTAVAVGPLKLPKLPLPGGAAPAHRARAVALEGVKGGFLVLSLPTAPALAAPARFYWLTLLGVAVLLVAGVVLGFFVRGAEAPAALPEELLAAATRIERGDFSARVPVLAGQLGTVATALNRAAELAGPAAAGVSGRASVTDEFFARGAAPKAEPAAQQPEPTPAPAPAAPAPELLQSAARAAPAAPAAAPEVDEETHWQQIFQEFLRTRASCGEASEGLTYDKFRLKLDGNKAALVSKYGCRTVKFQVYVKDGKAALKATPVK